MVGGLLQALRITPAKTGNTYRPSITGTKATDHPRKNGEHHG